MKGHTRPHDNLGQPNILLPKHWPKSCAHDSTQTWSFLSVILMPAVTS